MAENQATGSPLHLVFSGSGADFPCFVGVLKALLRTNPTFYDRLASVTASSGGAIVGLLAVLHCSVSFMEQLLISVQYSKHLQRIDLRNLFTHYGLDDSGGLVKVLRRILTQRIGHPDSTLLDLYSYTRDILKTPCTFRVTATDVTNMNLAVFDHINTPQLEVWKAIKITTSIPLVFTSTTWEDRLYCDGAVLSYFPLHLLPPFNASEQVIGIMLERGTPPNVVTDLLSFVIALAKTVNRYTYDHAKNWWEPLKTRPNLDIICVQPFLSTLEDSSSEGRSAVDVHRSTQEKLDMITLGYSIATSYLRADTTIVKHLVRDVMARVLNSVAQS